MKPQKNDDVFQSSEVLKKSEIPPKTGIHYHSYLFDGELEIRYLLRHFNALFVEIGSLLQGS